MSAIDNVTEHYAGLERRTLEVPEWKLTIHFGPLTVSERSRIVRDHLPEDRRPTNAEVAVDTIIRRACDAAGKPLFSVDDRQQLLHRADSQVVNRVASALLAVPSVEDMEKN